MEITLKFKSKLTQILMEGEATKRMVDDFNLSIQDLELLEIEELMAINENIIILQGAIDDIKRTLAEKRNILEEKSVEFRVSNLLDSYLNPKEDKIEEVHSEKALRVPDKMYIEKATVVPNEVHNEKEKAIPVPDEVYQAVKLFNKYRVGIPYIEDGKIIEDIKAGKLPASEAIMAIKRIYAEVIQVAKLDDEDVSTVIHTLLKECA